MTHRTNIWLKKKIIELKKKYSQCPICKQKNDSFSEFAHIKDNNFGGMGRGRRERYYNIIKHPDCYRRMHHDCHEYYDNVLKDNEAYPETFILTN